jgi:formylglycine-generating enzyme
MVRVLVLITILTLAAGAFAQDIQRDVSTPWLVVLKVEITAEWTQTGLTVELGDTVVIMADGIASTEGANPSPRQFDWVGPEGKGQAIAVSGFPMAGVPEQCVLGKIGSTGTPFYIGRGLGFRANKSGTLYVGYNDTDFSQNYGTYILYVFRYHEGVLVEGGTFQMGSTSGNPSEQPVHTVTVGSFYLDPTEVTVAKYRAFCTATGRSMPIAPSWGWSDDNPVVNVSWNDATEYAKWAGKRLPTEAEWEYAARGGNQSYGYTYSGSNSIDPVAWYIGNSGSRTHAVGTKTPNELGLYDMSGNAFEWCSDYYDGGYYSASPSVNPKGPSTGTNRALRSGAWLNVAVGCRVASRNWAGPTDKAEHMGFRCVRDGTTVVGVETEGPDFPLWAALDQNYPNPFNPSTTIRYGLPNRSHVTLTVFNTLGQQISLLQDGEQEPGYHEVRFDGSNLASGVYFCRMQAGDFVITRKLLLVR